MTFMGNGLVPDWPRANNPTNTDLSSISLMETNFVKTALKWIKFHPWKRNVVCKMLANFIQAHDIIRH